MPFNKILSEIELLNRPSGEIWFRGQANSEWQLIPRLLRTGGGHAHESRMLARFRIRAMGLLDSYPPDNDPARWLFLMQHHGLPTRLLDWSESALTALYFAVKDEEEKDGVVYILLPIELNGQQVDTPAIYSPYYKDAHEMLLAAFKGAPVPEKIFSMLAYSSNERVANQSGHFTVHGTSSDLRSLDCASWLKTVVIPASDKMDIRRKLAFLGISRTTLFRDLDSLAADIREQHGVN